MDRVDVSVCKTAFVKNTWPATLKDANGLKLALLTMWCFCFFQTKSIRIKEPSLTNNIKATLKKYDTNERRPKIKNYPNIDRKSSKNHPDAHGETLRASKNSIKVSCLGQFLPCFDHRLLENRRHASWALGGEQAVQRILFLWLCEQRGQLSWMASKALALLGVWETFGPYI